MDKNNSRGLNKQHLDNFGDHCRVYFQTSLSINNESKSTRYDQELQACQVILNALENQLLNAHQEKITHEHRQFLSSNDVQMYSSQLKSCGLYIDGNTTSLNLCHQELAEYASIRDEERRKAHKIEMEKRRSYFETLIMEKTMEHSQQSNASERADVRHAQTQSSQSFLRHVRKNIRDFCKKYKDNIGCHSFLAGIKVLIDKQMRESNKVVVWTLNGSTLSEVSFSSIDPNLNQCGQKYMDEAVDLLLSFMVFYPNEERIEEAKVQEFEFLYSFYIHPTVSNAYLGYILSEFPLKRDLHTKAAGSFAVSKGEHLEDRTNANGEADEQMSLIAWRKGFNCEIL